MTHWTRTLIALFAAIGLTLGLGATAHAKSDVTLIVTELPGQVRLIPGESIELVLDTNRTTGFTWKARERGDKKAITVGKPRYTAPVTELVGAPGITSWRVTADRPGKAVVRIEATPPGGGDPIVSRLTVIVMQPQK
jgi:predicted secreted protein